LPCSENSDPKPKRKPRRIRIRLTRNLAIYYRKTNSDTENHKNRASQYAHKAYQLTKKEAWEKPIEFAGVIVLIAYTTFAGYQSCQMKRATDAAKVAAEAARTQANAAIGANRPLMVPIGWGLSTEKYPNGTVAEHIEMVWTKLGHVPAMQLQGTSDTFGPTESESIPNFHDCPKSGTHDDRAMLSSGEQPPFSVRALSNPLPLEQWNKRVGPIIVHQCVTYEDPLSGAEWFTEVCLTVREAKIRDTFQAVIMPCAVTDNRNAPTLRFGHIDRETGAHTYDDNQ